MPLSMFAVVYERENASTVFDNPLVHCYAGKQIVLTYISRQALMDYFSAPGDAHITLQQWNLVVDRNLDALKRIIEEKYEGGYWMLYNAYGQTYPRLVITSDDMRASGQEFTLRS